MDIDVEAARALLAEQCPDWSALPLRSVASAGTDHALFRIGDAMVMRLPRLQRVVAQVEKEQRWLPELASQLPLEIPRLAFSGTPGAGFPWPWSIHGWIEGEDAEARTAEDPLQAARELGRFVTALDAIAADAGPAPGAHNFHRGVPLAALDAVVAESLDALVGEIDVAAARAAWASALAVPPRSAPPCWVHGDLHQGNLLVRDGALVAVIDFGGLAVGDPAVDLIAGWTLFEGEAREAFRAAAAVDDDTWARGRGWALYTALVALPYYRDDIPIRRRAQHTLAAVLEEAR